MSEETFENTSSLRALIGKSVKDFYGREAGHVIGINVDNLGQLNSVGIDEGRGKLMEYSSNNIIFEDGSLVIVPKWRVDIERVGRESETAQKRANALQKLLSEGQIARDEYEDKEKEYEGQASSLKSSYEKMVLELRDRIEEMDRQKKKLDRFLLETKIQHETGEIDDEIFQETDKYIVEMLKRDTTEKEDIQNILNSIENVESESEPVQNVESEQDNIEASSTLNYTESDSERPEYLANQDTEPHDVLPESEESSETRE